MLEIVSTFFFALGRNKLKKSQLCGIQLHKIIYKPCIDNTIDVLLLKYIYIHTYIPQALLRFLLGLFCPGCAHML